MATNDELSPAVLGVAAVAAQRPERATQSKRDRRRQLLVDRLSTLSEKFSRERDLTYRDQLQKAQVDASLVQRLDPYSPTALDDIAKLRDQYQLSQPQGQAVDNARTLLGMAGPKFQEYLQSVEDSIEVRDYLLTRQKVWPLGHPTVLPRLNVSLTHPPTVRVRTQARAVPKHPRLQGRDG